MEPFFVFIIIIYVAIYLIAGRKARKKQEEKNAQNERRYQTSNRPQPDTNYRSSSYRTSAPTSYRTQPAPPRAAAQSYSPDSNHYHREGYDFATCFSFKDVPQGVDELSALIAANARHERELQKLLHTREE